MANLESVLKSSVANSSDAETVSHDALASINARANEIKKNMEVAKKLQDNHAEMKFAIGATVKALDDLETQRRQKRDAAQNAEDFEMRLQRLLETEKRLKSLRENNAKMISSLKSRFAKVRSKLSQ